MTWISVLSIALAALTAAAQSEVDDKTYVGYGSGYTQDGTGKKVNTASALKGAAKSGGKITISGRIQGPAVVIPASNTHIMGDGTAQLEKISFYIGTKNVTLQNLQMHLPSPKREGPDHDNDLIHIEGPASNIWIDHCDISAQFDGVSKDHYDGLIDVKKGPSKITLSWNFIHDAHKVNLNGYSDKDASDWQLSIHHNIFNNVGSRLPSVRGGKGAIFNNYYVKVKNSAINSRHGAEMYCEKNYFDGVGTGKEEGPLGLGEGPIGAYYSDMPGKYNSVDNYYIRCFGNQPANEESTTNYKPGFMDGNKTIIPVLDVPEILMAKAGVKGIQKILKLPENDTRIIPIRKKVEKFHNAAPSAFFNILGVKSNAEKATAAALPNKITITWKEDKPVIRLLIHH